jgi:hypothetical protein
VHHNAEEFLMYVDSSFSFAAILYLTERYKGCVQCEPATAQPGTYGNELRETYAWQDIVTNVRRDHPGTARGCTGC